MDSRKEVLEKLKRGQNKNVLHSSPELVSQLKKKEQMKKLLMKYSPVPFVRELSVSLPCFFQLAPLFFFLQRTCSDNFRVFCPRPDFCDTWAGAGPKGINDRSEQKENRKMRICINGRKWFGKIPRNFDTRNESYFVQGQRVS